MYAPFAFQNVAPAGPSTPSARYWRYYLGSCACGVHHPRVSRIDFFDATTSSYINLITYTTDNCSDTGGIPGNPPCYAENSGIIAKDFGSTSTAITGCRFYNTYNGAVRCATIQIQYSNDNVNFVGLWEGNATTSPSATCGLYTISLTQL
jgi:hypothetical protein